MFKRTALSRADVMGIYQIVNTANGKRYIGSSKDLKTRRRSHFKELKENLHYNERLQNSWNKHSEANFQFRILETVEKEEDLILREQYYIDTFHPEYNIYRIAGSPLGAERSEETKQILREKGKEQWNSSEYREKVSIIFSNPAYRKQKSDEQKARWKTKEYREKMKQAHSDPEYKACLKERAVALWGNDEFKEKVMATRTSERYRKENSERVTSLWRDSEYRKKQEKIRTSEAYRKEQARAVKERWADPEFKKRVGGSISKAKTKKKEVSQNE